MSCPQEPSPKYSLAFRRLCLAILCERWAAFMLISTVAMMLGQRFGFSRPSALRLWGLVSAASYVGALPADISSIGPDCQVAESDLRHSSSSLVMLRSLFHCVPRCMLR